VQAGQSGLLNFHIVVFSRLQKLRSPHLTGEQNKGVGLECKDNSQKCECSIHTKTILTLDSPGAATYDVGDLRNMFFTAAQLQ
jgi:hypothetical protein